MLGGTGFHAEDAAGGEAVDEVSGTYVLAGQLLANESVQNLKRLGC